MTLEEDVGEDWISSSLGPKFPTPILVQPEGWDLLQVIWKAFELFRNRYGVNFLKIMFVRLMQNR